MYLNTDQHRRLPYTLDSWLSGCFMTECPLPLVLPWSCRDLSQTGASAVTIATRTSPVLWHCQLAVDRISASFLARCVRETFARVTKCPSEKAAWGKEGFFWPSILEASVPATCFCVISVLVHCEAEHSDEGCVEEPSGSPRGGWEVIRNKKEISPLEARPQWLLLQPAQASNCLFSYELINESINPFMKWVPNDLVLPQTLPFVSLYTVLVGTGFGLNYNIN